MTDMKTTTSIVWNDGVKGKGTLKSEAMNENIAIPTVLGGSGNGAFPKEVLVASVGACYAAGLVSMIESRELPLVELKIDSEGFISDDEFKIVHHPHMILSGEATEKQLQIANRLFAAADKGCAVGNLLKKADVKIEVEGKLSTK